MSHKSTAETKSLLKLSATFTITATTTNSWNEKFISHEKTYSCSGWLFCFSGSKTYLIICRLIVTVIHFIQFKSGVCFVMQHMLLSWHCITDRQDLLRDNDLTTSSMTWLTGSASTSIAGRNSDPDTTSLNSEHKLLQTNNDDTVIGWLCVQLYCPPSAAELFRLSPTLKSGTLYRNTSSQLPRCSPSGVTWKRFYCNNLSAYGTLVHDLVVISVT